jgi:hypothetical protein
VSDELGPEARALLDAAREGLSPDAAAVRRVRAKVTVAAGAGAAGAALGMKLALVALIAAGAAGAGLYVTRGGPPAMAPQVELPSPSEAPWQTVTRELAAPARSDHDRLAIEAPRVATPRRVGPSVQASPAAPPAPPPDEALRTPDRERLARGEPARPMIDLAREVELLDTAMADLRRGDAGGALVAVQRHAVETAGHGQLAEDAAAIEIEALCQLHDPTTNAKLEAFDARFPRSAQRSRLENQCR